MIFRTVVLCVTLLVASTTKEYGFTAVSAADNASGSKNNGDRGNAANGEGSQPSLANFRSNTLPALRHNSFSVAAEDILSQPNTILLEKHLAKYSKTANLMRAQSWPFERLKNKAGTTSDQPVTFSLVDHTVNNNKNKDASGKANANDDSDDGEIFGYIKDRQLRNKLRHYVKTLSFQNQNGEMADTSMQSRMRAKSCKNDLTEHAQIHFITLSRYPIMPGTKLDVTINGYFGILSVLESLNHGVACPIYPGDQKLQLSIAIPASLPGGISLDVTITGISRSGLTLFCAVLNDIMIDYPPIAPIKNQ
ncbi:hypothetical protein BDF22DRAFT_676774 [Syncephalis plumigaleata]|nr:hypothetical protein BDF22DRAFT_676774 [Syncephalis plumigaleata]